jgi:hypothetical protein
LCAGCIGELHYNYYRDYDSSTGRYLQADPRGILLDFSDPQRRAATQAGLPMPSYGYVSGLNHSYGYTNQNPLINVDPTGEGIIAGSICLGAGAIYNAASIADLGLKTAELNSIQDNIDKLENECPEQERSETYNNYLEALREEHQQLAAQTIKEHGPAVAEAGFFAIACAMALSPLIPF